MHTTLNLLWRYHACETNVTDFQAKLGPEYGPDTPISFLTFLDLQGLDDTLWALRAVPVAQRKERDSLCRNLLADYAEHLLPIATIRLHLTGHATAQKLEAARAAAWKALMPSARAAESQWQAEHLREKLTKLEVQSPVGD